MCNHKPPYMPHQVAPFSVDPTTVLGALIIKEAQVVPDTAAGFTLAI